MPAEVEEDLEYVPDTRAKRPARDTSGAAKEVDELTAGSVSSQLVAAMVEYRFVLCVGIWLSNSPGGARLCLV